MAAWSVAGIWTADEALRLTDIRARLMDGVAGPDGRLGYVRGLERATLEHLLETHRCEIAIRNPGLLVVIGGAERDVIDLCQEATTQGAARAGLLAVKIASHTSRLEPACTPLQQALAASRRAPVAEPSDPPRRGWRRAHLLRDRCDSKARMPGRAPDRLGGDAGGSRRARGRSSPGPRSRTRACRDDARLPIRSIRCYAADGFRTIDGLRNWVVSE